MAPDKAETFRIAGEKVLDAKVSLANDFVRQFATSRATDSSYRLVPTDTYDDALGILGQVGEVLTGEREQIELSGSRGARAALQGKPMVKSLEWLGLLERILTNHLYADSGLELSSARLAVDRLAVLFDDLYRRELDAFKQVYDKLSGWQGHVGSDLVNYLLSGAPIDPDVLVEQAGMLAIDPHQPYRAYAFGHDPEPDPARWTSVRHRVLEVLWQRDTQRETLLLDRGGLMLALVPVDRPGPDTVVTLGELLGHEDLSGSLLITSGPAAPDLLSAGHSCRQALSALEIAMHRGLLGKITPSEDLALEILLLRHRQIAAEIASAGLGPLVEKPHLIDTLRAYIAGDLALQRTAEILVVHPNTVVYRLRQIAGLTGYDMRSIADITRIGNALTAWDIVRIGNESDGLRNRLLSPRRADAPGPLEKQ